jgi:hypothetical protein
MRVFLDANILFSAAKSDGAVRHLLRLILEQEHECWADSYVVSEAQRNLVAKGPEALQVFDALLAHLHVAATQPAVEARAETAWRHRPSGLSAAIGLGCDALATGDRTHFGGGYGRIFGGVEVHSPRSLAKRLLA